MRGKWMIALPAMLLALLAFFALPALAENEGNEAEWTVMFYMCGSDLESRYSYATENLREISECVYPPVQIYEVMDFYKDAPGHLQDSSLGRVNVLIETGGCKKWHARELGMNISTQALQRWRYEGYVNGDQTGDFSLEQTLPLMSMADPQTLSGFVRWCAEKYPAKKYALVLWDHGGGSKNGLFIDELFDGDMMHLDELGEALRDSGVHLEAVLFDACLMAGMETAYAVSDSADWMVASEEVVAGKGTAIGKWLQQLYICPTFDGEWLGRWICDMTMIKYAEVNDEQAQQLLTWSVIDLSRIPHLVEMMDDAFKSLGYVYTQYPEMLSTFAKYVIDVEHYGTDEGGENMWDLAGFLYTPGISMVIPSELYKEMMNAMREAVVYNQHGPGRSAARGLSYCLATDFDIAEMDTYARNCPMPNYLAFLDAISPWTAPDWVYQTAERLPEMSSMEAYRITAKKLVLPDGMPAIAFDDNNYLGTASVHYSFSTRDEETGEFISYGTMPAYFNASVGENGAFYADQPWIWPALEGQHVASYLVDLVKPGAREYLGSIPMKIGSDLWHLRYGYFMEDERYEVYGMWDGYEMDSGLFTRNVQSLSQLAGQKYQLIYPVYAAKHGEPSRFETADPQTLYRAMDLVNEPMPPGKYYVQYVVYDMFMRPMPLQRIEINWDGENVTLPEDFSWEGEAELKIPDAYWQ